MTPPVPSRRGKREFSFLSHWDTPLPVKLRRGVPQQPVVGMEGISKSAMRIFYAHHTLRTVVELSIGCFRLEVSHWIWYCQDLHLGGRVWCYHLESWGSRLFGCKKEVPFWLENSNGLGGGYQKAFIGNYSIELEKHQLVVASSVRLDWKAKAVMGLFWLPPPSQAW